MTTDHPSATQPLRVAIVADLLEEQWPSMDLVADMLISNLAARETGQGISVELLRPRLARLSNDTTWRRTRVGERFLNRLWDYPRWLREQRSRFDIFHVVDHSYAHVVHALPAESTIVTCHDADAFLPLIDSTFHESKLPKVFARRVLTGMQKAAWVTCVSQTTADALEQYSLVPRDRRVVIKNGVHQAFVKVCEVAERRMNELLGEDSTAIDVLHVGSCIARKRIDRLLTVFADIRRREPRARLIKAGGSMTPAQWALARHLGIADHILPLPFLHVEQLAALYRRAAVVLITSDREGFGLPIVEALSCGTPVVASDLPVMREVGGSAALYCERDDTESWGRTVAGVIEERGSSLAADRRSAGMARAATFSWSAFAADMAALYATVHRKTVASVS